MISVIPLSIEAACEAGEPEAAASALDALAATPFTEGLGKVKPQVAALGARIAALRTDLSERAVAAWRRVETGLIDALVGGRQAEARTKAAELLATCQIPKVQEFITSRMAAVAAQ